MRTARFTWIALTGALLGLCGFARASGSAEQKAVVIPLSGEVNDASRDDLFRRIDAARRLGAKVVILRIDTYGGLVTAGLDISRYLRDQSDLHTIAFVKTKAISAGALIAMACDQIVMSPGGQLGDCAPIIFDTGGRLEPMPATERAKAQSPILSDFAASARRNGYDPLLAEAMVRVETVVHVMVNDKGEKRFVGDADAAKLATQGWKPYPGMPDPVDGADSLLTVDADQAKVLGLSKQTLSTTEDVARFAQANVVADLSPSAGDQLIQFLGNPWMRYLLLTVFIMALNIVLHAPGHGAAEATAIITLALLLGVPLLEGYAQWWEIVLIMAGLALCAFEILVFPGHGASLIVGVLMIVFGLVATFVGREPAGTPGWLPGTIQAWRHIEQGLMVVIGGLVSSMFLSFWLRKSLPSIPYFRRLILTDISGAGHGAVTPTLSTAGVDAWPFVGTVGISTSELKPGGLASFPYADQPRATSVVSADGFVPAGTKVTVAEVRGSRVVVRRA